MSDIPHLRIKTEQVESFGKHALLVWVKDGWRHLHTDYWSVICGMAEVLVSAGASWERRR